MIKRDTARFASDTCYGQKLSMKGKRRFIQALLLLAYLLFFNYFFIFCNALNLRYFFFYSIVLRSIL